MKRESIGNLVEKTTQCRPENLGKSRFVYLDIAAVNRDAKCIEFPQILDVGDAPSRARKRVKAHDVLVSTVRPNLNAVALVPQAFDGEIASTGFCVLRAQPRVLDPRYLFYFTQTSSFITHLEKAATGASYPAVSDNDVLETFLPLPESIEDQHRIATVLNQADRLRRIRRYALELGDGFLSSVFLRLFGNPGQPETRWSMEQLGELGTLDRGRSRHRPRNAPHLLGGKYPFIQTGDVANSNGYIRSHVQTYSAAGLQQSKLWPAETLCITIAANIGKTGILTYPACFPDSIVGFTPGKRVKVEYIQFWLGFLQETLERTAPEVAQKNINLEILRELRCPVPPLSLQNEFAAVVNRCERLRHVHMEALRQAEHLFQTLLHRAFTSGL